MYVAEFDVSILRIDSASGLLVLTLIIVITSDNC